MLRGEAGSRSEAVVEFGGLELEVFLRGAFSSQVELQGKQTQEDSGLNPASLVQGL